MTQSLTIGKMTGTFLCPGVSKNSRLYTHENIAYAVKSVNDAIEAGNPPTSYSSHYTADDDKTLDVVARVTRAWQEPDGRARYEAEIPNTTAGRDYATLAKGGYHKGVSIRGIWKGGVKTIEMDGQKVVTAPGMQIKGIDATKSPGVGGAEIESVDLLESADENAIFESFEEPPLVEFEETTENEADYEDGLAEAAEALSTAAERLAEAAGQKNPKLPYGGVDYADPGYQTDKKHRYPIDTVAHIRAAWAYINVASNQKPYTSAQLARMKTKIKKAAAKAGIDIAKESAEFENELLELLEAYASMTVRHDGGSVTADGYAADHKKLQALAAQIASASMNGIAQIDPEVGQADLMVNRMRTNNMETDETPDVEATPTETTVTESGGDVAPTETEEAQMADETTTDTSTESAPALSDDIKALIASAVAEATASAVAAVRAETAPAAAETAAEETAAETAEEAPAAEATYSKAQVDEMIAQAATAAAEATRKAATEEFRQAGDGTRKGLVSEGTTGGATVTGAVHDPRELSKMSREEFQAAAYETWREDPALQALWSRVQSRVGNPLPSDW